MSESSAPTIQVRGSVTSQDQTKDEQASGEEGQQEETQPEEVQQAEMQQPRRSQRTRTLTEKGREMQDEKIKALQQRFNYIYDKWRKQVKSAKKTLLQADIMSADLLNDIIGDVTGLSADVQCVYDELRKIITPDQVTRRRVDQCVEISTFVVSRASSRLHGVIPEKEEQGWPEAGSVFDSSSYNSGSVTSILIGTSEHSSRSSVKRQDAAAEIAASQAVLKVLQDQEREQVEIECLEAEFKRKIAEQEAAAVKRRLQREEEEAKFKAQLEEEHAMLQRTLEEKRRRIQHLEAVKNLTAAQARMQVYDQEHDTRPGIVVDNKGCASTGPRPQCMSPVPQVVATSPNDSTAELIKVLTGALSANRIPVPEPTIFSGDPLKYSDWKLSFETLIDQKNIRDKEKIYYLRRYVSGQAKKAIDGYFLLGTETAYVAAFEILEERYGNPFTIAKAYRDKLQAWTKIGSKDSFELREFVDFLRSCEAAMVHIKALEILNDCNENRKILAKLPDWLTARWNRHVVEIEEEVDQFPSFSQFVKFLTREVKIACNPLTSLQSLKQSETEKPKPSRHSNFATRTLITSSKEKNTAACIFCKRTEHSLHTCKRFMEKPVADRVRFIQVGRLCFGCLKHGHHSKSCNSRSVCDLCQKRHPTCLHEERNKEKQNSPQARQTQGQEMSSMTQEGAQSAQHQEITTPATSNTVILHGENAQTAAIIPVWISCTTQPAQEILVYALLDSQSDTTFVLNEVTEALDVNKEQVKLKLSTMTSRTTVVCSQRVTNLQVRGFYSSQRISLPPVYTRDFIPANRTHIPTNETAKAWHHLEYLQDEIAPLQDCEVGLLIGYNCSQALLPREVVSGKENQPYAQRTEHGAWMEHCR
ncbi:uncharacterized protein LOC115794743 [Archocentrus centrarchus]|uniref:uncharacterized protein LOC115794743 n=1 Tax=Archocentrus centrarchus TaxID=63155 RepID=UPI0011EA47EC|nr:uncharacterized protein LOC115794743 [Archocentrus centrarchus]